MGLQPWAPFWMRRNRNFKTQEKMEMVKKVKGTSGKGSSISDRVKKIIWEDSAIPAKLFA
jgi:hypothetical protein